MVQWTPEDAKLFHRIHTDMDAKFQRRTVYRDTGEPIAAGRACSKCGAPNAQEITHVGLLCKTCAQELPLVCDFCKSEAPAWAYPCKDFEFMAGAWSRGQWAACEPCHGCIEKKDYDSLFQRWLNGFTTAGERTVKDREATRRNWKLFSRNRTGNPVRMDIEMTERTLLPQPHLYSHSAYMQAIERRSAWTHWAYNPTSTKEWDSYGIEKLPHFRYTLEHGDTFYMDPHFCRLVDHARMCMPDDIAFEHNWMLAQQGWLWLAEPFKCPPIVGKAEWGINFKDYEMPISAIGWRTLAPGTQVRGHDDRMRVVETPEFWFCGFIDFGLGQRIDKGFGAWSYFTVIDGAKLDARIDRFETVGKRLGDGSVYSRDAQKLHEIRWTYAAMYLMSQRLTARVRHNADRGVRRRNEADVERGRTKPVTPFVEVITLRRLQADRDKDPKGREVNWQWQWGVRGHGRKLASGKWTFVHAYVKGPKDKPIKPDTNRLFVASR